MKRLISQGSPYEDAAAYSRAVVCDGWVFVSGTTGFDYATMEISDDVVTQTRQTLTNIAWALGEAGATMEDVVRVNYILPQGDMFEACWPVLRDVFGTARPAATMIEARLLDPRMLIEIEVTARLPSS